MAEEGKIVTAAMLVIGNEILSGRTQDANMHYIAGRLNELGVRLAEARVVRDVTEEIVAAVNALRARYDYVFTSGGIGPTHDDITADAIASAFGLHIDIRDDARALLEAHYEPGQLTAARLRMARIPDGASLIDNPISTAPGFRVENVFVMAGVPAIFRAMFESCRHDIAGGAPLLSRTISSELPEGRLAEPLGLLQERYADVDMGSYPFYRGQRFGTSIVMRCTDAARLDSAVAELKASIVELGGSPHEGDPPA
ncbi:competence/damage-inducible protein A [Marinibaculum pumilum]|uniref:Competence/damage-inducible protein A n=1 Tax=Marinibaculum pumilum TaxID=1766165 RepID=A0ABV7L4A5_9PROT